MKFTAISIFYIIILLSLLTIIIYSIRKGKLIANSSGKIIVKRNLITNKILRVLLILLMIGLILFVLYLGYIEQEFLRSFISILWVVGYSIWNICFGGSNRFYTIYEKGICLGLCGFLKWENIIGFEIKNGFLEFKANKNTMVSKLKIEEEYTQKVESILEKNMVLPICN